MPKKKDFRLSVQAILPGMLNAVFQQGMAVQRAEDAKFDAEFAGREAMEEINKFIAIFNTPEKSEIN